MIVLLFSVIELRAVGAFVLKPMMPNKNGYSIARIGIPFGALLVFCRPTRSSLDLATP